MPFEDLNAQIAVASMLIQLGLSTVDKIKGFFQSEGHDDEKLAAIMLEVDQRLARRG